MFGHETCVKSIGTGVLAILVVLASVSTAAAQCCGSGSGGGGCCSGGGSGDHQPARPYEPPPPDPYDGQIFCPVTGKKLGLMGPPVLVKTTVRQVQPSFWEKLRGKKPYGGATLYVCCPACVAKVQAQPEAYLGEVMADRAFGYHYAAAPAQRPSRVREEVAQVSTGPAMATAEPYGGQKTCPVTGEPLGSMGAPVPVTVQGRTIYVCCRGCVAKVQRDPDVYLRKVEAEHGNSH